MICKFIFAIFLFLSFNVNVTAADWKVATTGTRSTCTPGSSWDNADVYPTIAAVINTCAASIAANDSVTLADGYYPAAIICAAALNAGGEITIRSASGNADKVIIGAATGASAALLSLSCAGGTNDFKFQNVTLTKTETHTAAALAFIMMQNEVRNVTFDGVKFSSFKTALAGNNASLSGAMVSRFNGTRAQRTITFRNVTFENFDMTYQNGFASIIQASASATDGTDIVIEGDNIFRNSTFSSTGTGAGTGFYGGFYVSGAGSSLTINGRMTFDNLVSDMKLSQQNHAMIRITSPVELKFGQGGKVICNNMTWSLDAVETTQAACIETTGPFSNIDIEANHVVVNTAPGANNTGAVLLTSTTASIGNAKIKCRYVSGLYGPCLYCGNGGTGSFLVDSMYVKAYEGIVYSGGWGATTRIGGLIAESDFIDRNNTGVVLELYSQIHPSTSTSSKISEIVGLTIGPRAEGVSADKPALYFSAGNPTYAHTVNIANVLDKSGAAVSALFNESSTGVLNTTIKAGGLGVIDASDIVNGSKSIATQISGNALFVGGERPKTAEGYKLKKSSPYRRTGSCIYTTGCIPYDLGNRRGRVPPDSGAWQND